MKIVIIEISPDAKDNRPLGVSGSFLTTDQHYGESDVAQFSSLAAAFACAAAAPNRRAGHQLFVPGAAKVRSAA